MPYTRLSSRGISPVASGRVGLPLPVRNEGGVETREPPFKEITPKRGVHVVLTRATRAGRVGLHTTDDAMGRDAVASERLLHGHAVGGMRVSNEHMARAAAGVDDLRTRQTRLHWTYTAVHRRLTHAAVSTTECVELSCELHQLIRHCCHAASQPLRRWLPSCPALSLRCGPRR
eukprot:scaffold294182_cov33-Tisochrysis_lutea.AAC.1